MLFDFGELPAQDRYKLLVSSVVPRPIAWVVSQDEAGSVNAARSAGSSFGLVGMRERIQMLGGQLCIDSQPGEGTTITARVPLDPLPLPSPASTGALPS
mgnify:CR=1 FL=1